MQHFDREIITKKNLTINHGAPHAACRLFLNRAPQAGNGSAQNPRAANRVNMRAKFAGSKANRARPITPALPSRMEKEMESMEHDFRLFQDQYGENTLHLGAAQRYVRKLLDNAKVQRFLNQRHSEILEELQELAALEAL